MWHKLRRFRGALYCVLVLWALCNSLRTVRAQSVSDVERRVGRLEDARLEIKLARLEAQMEDLRRSSDRSFTILVSCIAPLLLEMGVRLMAARLKPGGK